MNFLRYIIIVSYCHDIQSIKQATANFENDALEVLNIRPRIDIVKPFESVNLNRPNRPAAKRLFF